MDVSQIGTLVDEYGKDIYNFCRKLTYNEYDAEELYQDTFLKAIDAADRIDVNNNPKSYLLSISVSIWKNKKRKYARRNRIAPSESIDSEENGQIPSDECTPEEDLLKKELFQTVKNCVDELDEKMRIPVLLYYNAQMPLEQIAEVLKCPKGTVKSRLYKARMLLKERLEVYGVEGF